MNAKQGPSIVVAHRLSTIRHANEIIVLQEGKIVEQEGTHDFLMRQKWFYRRLVEMQEVEMVIVTLSYPGFMINCRL